LQQLALGAEHPIAEEWDTYCQYVGPQQQPRPKGKAAAAASADGAAGSGAPVAAPACSEGAQRTWSPAT